MRTAFLIVAISALGMPALADEFSQNFRDGKFSERTLRVVGSQDLLIREPEGLRITIDKESGNASNAGVAFPMQLAGDCAIEAAVELIDVPQPAGGYGTGVALLFEDGTANGASLQRVVMPKGQQMYVAHKYLRSAEGEYKHDAKTFPAAAASVVLRIERDGSQLTYLASEDGGKNFRELTRFPFTDEPLRVAQVYAQVGGEPNDLSIRVTDLKLTGDAFVRPGQKVPKKMPALQWLAVGLFVGLPVAGAGLWYYRRRTA